MTDEAAIEQLHSSGWMQNHDREMSRPCWISVKDRLPEDEGYVLVYGVSPRGRKKTAIMNYLAFEADRPRWALDGIWTVLYWMPLPEPPKEGENNA